MMTDAPGGGGTFEVVGALLARGRVRVRSGKPRIDVMLQAPFVQFIDEEELRLRPNGLGHVDLRVTIEQVVQPRRPGARSAGNQKGRSLFAHVARKFDQSI